MEILINSQDTWFPIVVFAYLDPGTGSIILQAILGIVLGSLLFLKNFWRNVSVRLGNLLRRKKNSDDTSEPLS